ncbi:hypothetical protein GS966_25575 [Rhodococcus hoagii]|nr:hypothetical protein [Prescottella equi]NKS61622.1 hypothetical protein [Prescottella equi]NKZ93273.1 hypothetical protein [Prescottella equi]
MRNYKALWIGGAVVALIAVVLVLVALNHQRNTSPPPNVGTDSHIDHGEYDPLSPEGAAPETVAGNAMSIIFGWKPADDESGWDALHRASDLVTGQLAVAAATAPTPLPRPVSEWDSWARSKDVVSASTVIPAGKSAIVSETTATVPVQISQTVLHPDGDMTPYKKMTATVELTKVNGTWLVNTYRIETTR